jgi:hypothetical protein
MCRLFWGKQKRPVSAACCLLLAAFQIFICLNNARAVDPSDHLKQYERWLIKNRDPRSGLTYSHIGDKNLHHWVMTYDSSVTALAYIALERNKDAKRILDFYINTPGVWRLNGIISTVNPTRPELGEEWSVVTGPNIWIGIAAFHLYKSTGELKYLSFAKDRADFALYLQNTDPKDKNFGAIRMGPLGDASLSGDQRIQNMNNAPRLYDIYSTEHAIDAYALFNLLFNETALQRYGQGRDRALNWLRQTAFNTKQEFFSRGARPAVDPAFATDVQSWAISALGLNTLDKVKEGLALRLVETIEQKAVHTVSFTKADGKKVEVRGVDYVDHAMASALGRPPMVSPEWTFGLINAYSRLERDLAEHQLFSQAESLRNKKQTLLENMLKLTSETGHGAALPYATQPNAKVGHGFMTPSRGNYSTISISYGILAITGFDPLYNR